MNGVPESTANDIDTAQSLKQSGPRATAIEPSTIRPERELDEQVSGDLIPLDLKNSRAPIGIQVLIVLRHHAPAASNRRGIVDRLRKRVAHAAADAPARRLRSRTVPACRIESPSELCQRNG